MQENCEKDISRVNRAGTEFEYSTYRIVTNYLDNTIRRYQRRCSTRRVRGFSVKREIKSEGTRGGISTGPKRWSKWSRLAETAEKQSRYTTCNNGTNICCSKVAFVMACALHARENVMSMRDEPYCGVRGAVCELRVYCSTW